MNGSMINSLMNGSMNSTMQTPGAALRGQTPGAALRGQTPGAALRGQTPGAALRGQTPGAALRGQTPGGYGGQTPGGYGGQTPGGYGGQTPGGYGGQTPGGYGGQTPGHTFDRSHGATTGVSSRKRGRNGVDGEGGLGTAGEPEDWQRNSTSSKRRNIDSSMGSQLLSMSSSSGVADRSGSSMYAGSSRVSGSASVFGRRSRPSRLLSSSGLSSSKGAGTAGSSSAGVHSIVAKKILETLDEFATPMHGTDILPPPSSAPRVTYSGAQSSYNIMTRAPPTASLGTPGRAKLTSARDDDSRMQPKAAARLGGAITLKPGYQRPPRSSAASDAPPAFVFSPPPKPPRRQRHGASSDGPSGADDRDVPTFSFSTPMPGVTADAPGWGTSGTPAAGAGTPQLGTGFSSPGLPSMADSDAEGHSDTSYQDAEEASPKFVFSPPPKAHSGGSSNARADAGNNDSDLPKFAFSPLKQAGKRSVGKASGGGHKFSFEPNGNDDLVGLAKNYGSSNGSGSGAGSSIVSSKGALPFSFVPEAGSTPLPKKKRRPATTAAASNLPAAPAAPPPPPAPPAPPPPPPRAAALLGL
jgi:hypothetical protein